MSQIMTQKICSVFWKLVWDFSLHLRRAQISSLSNNLQDWYKKKEIQ